jgi:hypothetical protein
VIDARRLALVRRRRQDFADVRGFDEPKTPIFRILGKHDSQELFIDSSDDAPPIVG